MDYFLFRDETSDVGGETDAYCANCKADTLHTVITMFEGDIRSVQCTICNATHNYRPPRGDQEDDVAEPIAQARQKRPRLPWNQVVGDTGEAAVPAYSPRVTYSEGGVIRHPVFGVGYVSEIVGEKKIEAVFEDGPRILVHGREDLPEPKRAAPRRTAIKQATPAQPVASRSAPAAPLSAGTILPAGKGAKTAASNKGKTTAKRNAKAKPATTKVAASAGKKTSSKRTAKTGAAATARLAKPTETRGGSKAKTTSSRRPASGSAAAKATAKAKRTKAEPETPKRAAAKRSSPASRSRTAAAGNKTQPGSRSSANRRHANASAGKAARAKVSGSRASRG